jgi:hypothetical protein
VRHCLNWCGYFSLFDIQGFPSKCAEKNGKIETIDIFQKTLFAHSIIGSFCSSARSLKIPSFLLSIFWHLGLGYRLLDTQTGSENSKTTSQVAPPHGTSIYSFYTFFRFFYFPNVICINLTLFMLFLYYFNVFYVNRFFVSFNFFNVFEHYIFIFFSC